MTNLLLIGDSIRLGYQARLEELLEGRIRCFAPEENCRFSAYTLFSLAGWMTEERYDVIHWNNGQWDTCYMPDGGIHTPLAEYLDYQKRIAGILRLRADRLIFATTTPVWDDQYKTADVNGRKSQDIIRYNEAVSEMHTQSGVEINDLHARVSGDIYRYICDDKVHLSLDGVEVCAAAIAELIGEDHA